VITKYSREKGNFDVYREFLTGGQGNGKFTNKKRLPG
jgi:hypothetical protein